MSVLLPVGVVHEAVKARAGLQLVPAQLRRALGEASLASFLEDPLPDPGSIEDRPVVSLSGDHAPADPVPLQELGFNVALGVQPAQLRQFGLGRGMWSRLSNSDPAARLSFTLGRRGRVGFIPLGLRRRRGVEFIASCRGRGQHSALRRSLPPVPVCGLLCCPKGVGALARTALSPGTADGQYQLAGQLPAISRADRSLGAAVLDTCYGAAGVSMWNQRERSLTPYSLMALMR